MGKMKIEDIMNLLKVSRTFIKLNIRNQDLDWELVQEGKMNTNIYVCSKEKLLQHIANNSKAYRYDTTLKGFHEKKRPQLQETEVPEQMKKEILSGDFPFMNAEEVLQKTGFSSRESIYQRVYKIGLPILRFKGKTYFWHIV